MRTSAALQERCDLAQRQLEAMRYLQAERILEEVEREAWSAGDWDTLSRLYLPLQEARRQRRQRCGEGMVCLDLVAHSAAEMLRPEQIIQTYPHGQLLVAGWDTIEPAVEVRTLARRRELYVETFLASVQATPQGLMVRIVPLAQASCEVGGPISLRVDELPRGAQPGDARTYAWVMGLWERLHAPFLAAADAETDPIRRMEAYRRAIEVDYACELAHQKLSDTARQLARRK